MSSLYDVRSCNNNEVSVNHEKAPTTPDSKGYWIFRIWTCFKKKLLSILADFFPVDETIKRHIYTSRSLIRAYKQVSLTIRSKVLARTRKRWQADGHPFELIIEIGPLGLYKSWHNPDKYIAHDWSRLRRKDTGLQECPQNNQYKLCQMRFAYDILVSYLAQVVN